MENNQTTSMNQEKIKESLFQLAKKAYANAYTPYSHFNVGAAAIIKGNKAFIGANVENAAYGSSICAERSCLLSAYSNGARQEDFLGFAVITDTKTPSMPCGACRQVLLELLEMDTPIYVFNLKGECIETDVATLVPYPFTSDDLKDV